MSTETKTAINVPIGSTVEYRWLHGLGNSISPFGSEILKGYVVDKRRREGRTEYRILGASAWVAEHKIVRVL